MTKREKAHCLGISFSIWYLFSESWVSLSTFYNDFDNKLESCFDGGKNMSMVGASVDFYNMSKMRRVMRMKRLTRISMNFGGTR
jgi:hypothetical protein